jgi:hypothetical protein
MKSAAHFEGARVDLGAQATLILVENSGPD